MIGTRISTGAPFLSDTNSGMYMKSMVEESLTALRLREVLKWRAGLPVSFESRTGVGRRRLAGGLSDVRSEEKVVGPVMESERVVVEDLEVEVDVRALRARWERRAVDIVA
jgi:hypothetical protein